MRLEDKVALISGGTRAMGAAEARLSTCEGAKVVFIDILEQVRTEGAGRNPGSSGRGGITSSGRNARGELEAGNGWCQFQVRSTEYPG